MVIWLRRIHPNATWKQSDEWTEGRRYMGLELLAKSRIRIVTTVPDTTTSEPPVTTEALTA